MKIVSYASGDNAPRAGVVVGDAVFDLAEGAAQVGASLPDSVLDLLDLGTDGLTTSDSVASAAEEGKLQGVPQQDVSLVAAVPNPRSIFLLAGNYQSHITEGGAQPVNKDRINPRPFMKPGTAIIASGDEIVIPDDSETLDYEIEIAAVIGTTGKSIPVDKANDHVAGYVVFNDVSARSLKIADDRDERDGDGFFDWLLGKWCDSFAAIGPYLVTKDEAGDPNSLEMALKVNGELRQHSSAGEMIFTIPEAIAFLSRFVTLRSGDLLCMGTPGGVGATTETYLKPGDLVEAEIETLGKLVNKVR